MTLKDRSAPGGIEALKSLLEIYGADRSRWPARDRLKFAELLADHHDARQVMAEAEALDRLLDMAPEPKAAELTSLSARILSAAAATPQRTPAGNVTPLSAAAKPRSQPSKFRPRRVVDWPAAALMAASLVLGIFAGTNGYLGDVTGSDTELAQSADNDQSDASALAFGTDAAGLLEEDLL